MVHFSVYRYHPQPTGAKAAEHLLARQSWQVIGGMGLRNRRSRG
jgi:hypothetical protein